MLVQSAFICLKVLQSFETQPSSGAEADPTITIFISTRAACKQVFHLF